MGIWAVSKLYNQHNEKHVGFRVYVEESRRFYNAYFSNLMTNQQRGAKIHNIYVSEIADHQYEYSGIACNLELLPISGLKTGNEAKDRYAYSNLVGAVIATRYSDDCIEIITANSSPFWVSLEDMKKAESVRNIMQDVINQNPSIDYRNYDISNIKDGYTRANMDDEYTDLVNDIGKVVMCSLGNIANGIIVGECPETYKFLPKSPSLEYVNLPPIEDITQKYRLMGVGEDILEINRLRRGMYISSDIKSTSITVPEGVLEVLLDKQNTSQNMLEQIVLPETCQRLIGNPIPDLGQTTVKYLNAENLEFIGENALSNCMIESFEAGEKLQEVGTGAFYKCQNLKYVDLSKSKVCKIGENAFNRSENLEKVILPLKKSIIIDPSAFKWCTSLTDINTESVLAMGNNAFAYSGVTEIDLKSARTLAMAVFEGCEGLKVIRNTLSLARIYDSCFYGCIFLELDEHSLVNVTEIGGRAFNNCRELDKLVLSNITSIGNNVFENSGIKKIYFGKRLVHMGDDIFRGCDHGVQVYLAEGYENEEIVQRLNRDIRVSHIRYISDEDVYKLRGAEKWI